MQIIACFSVLSFLWIHIIAQVSIFSARTFPHRSCCCLVDWLVGCFTSGCVSVVKGLLRMTQVLAWYYSIPQLGLSFLLFISINFTQPIQVPGSCLFHPPPPTRPGASERCRVPPVSRRGSQAREGQWTEDGTIPFSSSFVPFNLPLSNASVLLSSALKS